MYDQSYKSVVKLKVFSFKEKFIKGTNSAPQDSFYFSSYKTSMSCFTPLNLFHLASWFLLLNPTSQGPIIHQVLFLFFPVFILFSSFYITTYFSTSTSNLPAFYHSPLITDNHMLWSSSISYLFFPLYFSHRNFFSPLKYYILSHFSKNGELKY